MAHCCESDSTQWLPPDQSNKTIQKSNFTSVGDPWLQLKELDAEAVQLKTRLGDISRERALLKQQINRLSPILQLSLEIISEIFLFSFPYDDEHSWVGYSPLLFGKICRMWREIAWSTPRLWCHLGVGFNREKGSERAWAVEIDLLQEWLERTKNLPLLLCLILDDPAGDIVGMNKFMDIIARRSEQWEIVEFSLYHLFRHDRCFVPVHFPRLKFLGLNIEEEAGKDTFTSLSFRDAHLLRDVHLDGFRHLPCIELPLIQPLKITLGCTTINQCLSILEANPHCTLFDVKWLEDADISYPNIVVVPQLKTLVVCADASEHGLARFFNSLAAPALTDLTIVDNDSSFPQIPLVSFITRSACVNSLVSLSLTYNSMSVADFTAIFPLTPCLVSLSLDDIELRAEMIACLTLRYPNDGPDGFLIPKLQSFSFHGKCRFPLSVLVDFMCSRLRIPKEHSGSVQPLQSVRIRDKDKGSNLEAQVGRDEVVNKFKAEGIMVSVCDQGDVKVVSLESLSGITRAE